MSYWYGMSFLWWIFWVAVMAALVSFVMTTWRRAPSQPHVDSLEILRRRYAAGEITTAEYDERRARLLETAPRGAEPVHPTTLAPPAAHAGSDEQRTEH